MDAATVCLCCCIGRTATGIGDLAAAAHVLRLVIDGASPLASLVLP